MGDQEAVERAFLRRPGAHAYGGAGAQEVDRRVAAEIVPARVGRQDLLVRSPAKLGRLTAFADEAVDRPGVHELAAAFAEAGDLGVAFGDVDGFHAQRARQRRPALAGCRRRRGLAGVAGDVEHRLLDEMRDQAGIGAMRHHRGGSAGNRPPGRERAFAQRIVGTLGWGQRRIGVAADPGLDAGVEIQRAPRLAQFGQRDGGDVHRQVQQEVARGQQRRQFGAVVLPRQWLHTVRHAVFGGHRRATIIAGEDGDPLLRHVDVPEDQRQNALADAAEAEHEQPAGERNMFHR